MPFPAVKLLDTFEGPNENPIAGSWGKASGWSAGQIFQEEYTGHEFGAPVDAAFWLSGEYQEPAVAAQCSQFPGLRPHTHLHLLACSKAVVGESYPEGYELSVLHEGANLFLIQLLKRNEGGEVILFELKGHALFSLDWIGLLVHGGVVSAWVKAGEGGTWTELGSAADSTFTSGHIGVASSAQFYAEKGASGLKKFSAISTAEGAPVNTSLPTITGPATQGIAEVETEGTWEHGPILKTTWQWKREGTSIEGATNQTYVPTVKDIGHTLTVVETVTNTGGSTHAESLPTPVIEPGVPTNTSLPTINGPAVEGEVEYEGHAGWSVVPESFKYQWFLCDPKGNVLNPIEGANRKTYVPVPGDVGHTLRVSEIAVDKAGESSPATSQASPVIQATAATQEGLKPTQPDVPEPVLKWPFRMASDQSRIVFIEQDEPEEVEQCVALTLLARPGEFPDEPAFGTPDPTFSEGGVAEAALAAVLRKWEPRALLFFTLDELIGFAQEVAIEVKPS